nr:hypothetical protein MACL_00001884 [Theileria orientalis]
MGGLSEVKGTSFNQLVKIIKEMARRKDSVPRREETSKILQKIGELASSMLYLMKEHPYHIPVILYHLSSITSRIEPPRQQECVSRISEKRSKTRYNSCKTCNGVCDEVYVNFADVIRNNLVYLSPKGLSQVLVIHSECKNEEMCKIMAEIKLRMCYFMYCRCKNASKSNAEDDIDAIVDQYSVVFEEYAGIKLQKDDYLVNFIKFGSLGCENVDKHSSYYLPLSLMDICVTLESIAPSQSSNGNEEPYGRSGNLLSELIVRLSFKLLKYHNYSKREAVERPKVTSKCELDSVCRLIGLFKRLKYRDESILNVIAEILNNNLQQLDFRNLVTLLDSFSVLSEIVVRKKGNDTKYSSGDADNKELVGDPGYDSVYHREEDDFLVSNRYGKLDFKSIVSRIVNLTKVDSPDYLRSLSTINQVISRIGKRVFIADYEHLTNVTKQSLIRYVSKNPNELKNTRAIAAIAMLLSNIQEPEVISIVSDAILEDLITFDRRNLYDYDVIIDVLIKNYRKYAKIAATLSGANSVSTGANGNIKNTEDVCKLYSSICLMVSKCSSHYCGVLEERLSASGESGNHGVSLSGMPLREMCYFLVNLEAFSRLQRVENPFLDCCNVNIANLTRNLEWFFTRYHTRLCEMDHYQISNYLSQMS